jgi:Trypsin-like peptidase domain
MALDRRRITEVWVPDASGGGQAGSGYLLENGLVLTAKHVLTEAQGGKCEVRLLGSEQWAPATVLWASQSVDGALLESGLQAPAHTQVLWGEIQGSDLVGCTAVGFPWAQERPGSVRDTEQLYGHVAPATAVKEGLYGISVITSPPAAPRKGGSPWSGMSGAALFSGPYLVGVIVVDPGRFGPDRVGAVPAATMFADEEAARLVGAPVLTAIQPRFRLVVTAGLSFVLQAPYRPLPRQHEDEVPAPASLLRPEHGVVPFLGREQQLVDLAAWCEGKEPVGVLIVSGQGGSGKSRLAAETCVWMAGQGWNAGFADTTAPEAPNDETNVHLDTDSLIIVDDAEANVALVANLIKHLASQETGAKARILLVARHRGVWLEKLQQLTPELDTYPITDVELDADLLDANERERHFLDASRAFAARLRRSDESEPVWPLSQPVFSAPLLVHINALLAVSGERASADSTDKSVRNQVLDRLLDHEKERWDRSAPVAVHDDRTNRIRDRSAVIAILASGSNSEETTALLAVVPGLSDVDRRTEVAAWLHELYPGADLSGLQPDLLAGRHLGRTLPAPDIPDLLTRLYDRIEALERRVQFLTVLRPETDEGALGPLIHRFLAGLLEAPHFRVTRAQYGHQLSSEKTRHWPLLLGVLVVIFTTIVGTAAFAAINQDTDDFWKAAAGTVSIIAAVFASMQTFFAFGLTPDRHRFAAVRYAGTRRSIEFSLTSNYAPTFPYIMEEIDRTAAESPQIDRKRWEEAGAMAKEALDAWHREEKRFAREDDM